MDDNRYSNKEEALEAIEQSVSYLKFLTKLLPLDNSKEEDVKFKENLDYVLDFKKNYEFEKVNSSLIYIKKESEERGGMFGSNIPMYSLLINCYNDIENYTFGENIEKELLDFEKLNDLVSIIENQFKLTDKNLGLTHRVQDCAARFSYGENKRNFRKYVANGLLKYEGKKEQIIFTGAFKAFKKILVRQDNKEIKSQANTFKADLKRMI